MIFSITPTDAFILAGLFLIALELFLGVQTGFDLVLVGIALAVSGVIGGVVGNVEVSIISAIVLSVLYIFFGRNLIKQKLVVMTHKTNIDKLIGSKGIVIRSITPDTTGMVRIDDEDWRATSDQVLYEKDKIVVLGLTGITLKVEKRV